MTKRSVKYRVVDRSGVDCNNMLYTLDLAKDTALSLADGCPEKAPYTVVRCSFEPVYITEPTTGHVLKPVYTPSPRKMYY